MKKAGLQNTTQSPLQPGGPLIAHFGYSNMGAMWLTRALTRVGADLAMPVQVSRTPMERLQHQTKIFVVYHSHLRCDQLREYHGTHLIRDLRDVAVLGYFRHRATDENWAHRPVARYGGRTYHQVLNSVDEHQGLLEEIQQLSEYVRKYATGLWDYQSNSFLEMRYEDILAKPGKAFHRMFRHYHFDNETAKAATQTARGVGRSIARGTSITDQMETTAGFWREHMKPNHTDRFKELLGDTLIRMGYVDGNSW